MKILSLLFSLLLGAGVLLFFLQPWDKIETMLGGTGRREAAPLEPTAAVEAAPPKPAEAAAPPPVAKREGVHKRPPYARMRGQFGGLSS